MPAAFTNGTVVLGVSPTFKFTSTMTIPTLNRAFQRYTSLIFNHAQPAVSPRSPIISGLVVSVDSVDTSHPQIDTDESYTLTIAGDGSDATINAKNVYGAMRGLETFAQLVSFEYDTQSYMLPAAPWKIVDSPRFPHRGLMIDTARHFLPLHVIYRVIDSLPFAKLNVLHWHNSDSQSFPFQSKSSPRLWNGAFTPAERYTQADIAAVVEYARDRGIRVMVEFDMPGHAQSWCAGYPDVCPSATCTTPLNPASPNTFTLITNLLNECTGGQASTPGKPSGLFPDNFIHLGGDEVDTTCWSNTPSIAAWMKQNNYTADDAYAYFVSRAASIAIAQGRRPVQWVEVFDHFGSKLDKRTIVHVWKEESTLGPVVAAGYNALIDNSPGNNSWYLDHLDVTWQACYSNEPCASISDPKQCALVLGGQGEMWGETVDSSDLEQTVWPKLAAIAEKLWSPRAQTGSPDNAALRMANFRCLLNSRGVRAAPVNNKNARSAPPGPGSCYQQ